ncbi:hypothetical protein O4H66_23805 [Comamonadaceae bacterium G21597-S1]|nr:hypothetical protein [Comamonadaceae bacterium G21597-S1]
MSDTSGNAFGKFVPGFDFLQNLAKGATQSIPQIPNLANWVSPSLNVEELEKRIEELRAVHFWLEQNSRALGATIQALEVQKMTLATLKGMNFNIGDVANAFKLKAADSVASGVQMASERAATAAAKAAADAPPRGGSPAGTGGKKSKPAAATGSLIDPLQLWGSLTQQFQQIAASALQEATRKTAVDATRNMSTGLAKEAVKAGKKAVAARKTARKTTRKTTSRSKT